MHLPPAAESRAGRRLNTAAAILASGVLIDSAAEHYRAGFHNRAMFIAPMIAAGVLATTAQAAFGRQRRRSGRSVICAGAMLTGVAGFGFHLRNVSRRTGGWISPNVFFGAPLAAPFAITVAGLFGMAGDRLDSRRPVGTRLPAALCGLATLGLIGTSIEAGALHFRGAFQNPFMYPPVTVPPLAGVMLATATRLESPRIDRAARLLLRSTVALGVLGVGFHAWGVQRRMGGWRNWRQNLLAGPPLPAPPAFTGLALAGMAALDLVDARRVR